MKRLDGTYFNNADVTEYVAAHGNHTLNRRLGADGTPEVGFNRRHDSPANIFV